MMAADQRRWRKSSHSAHETDCVEVAPMPSAAAVRDSKNRERGELRVTRAAWASFIRVVRAT